MNRIGDTTIHKTKFFKVHDKDSDKEGNSPIYLKILYAYDEGYYTENKVGEKANDDKVTFLSENQHHKNLPHHPIIGVTYLKNIIRRGENGEKVFISFKNNNSNEPNYSYSHLICRKKSIQTVKNTNISSSLISNKQCSLLVEAQLVTEQNVIKSKSSSFLYYKGCQKQSPNKHILCEPIESISSKQTSTLYSKLDTTILDITSIDVTNPIHSEYVVSKQQSTPFSKSGSVLIAKHLDISKSEQSESVVHKQKSTPVSKEQTTSLCKKDSLIVVTKQGIPGSKPINSFISKNKILLLGMSYSDISKKSYNLDIIYKLILSKSLSVMDGRDLARIHCFEKQSNIECYTVSLVESDNYLSNRHIQCDFNNPQSCNQLIKQFGRITFQEIYLDYFWIPQGEWQINHWKKTFFNCTLVNFATLNLIKPNGVIYLPFTLHCMCNIAEFESILKQYYLIEYINKKDLHKVGLWSATHSINKDEMSDIMEKDINQEETYCKITTQMIRETVTMNDNRCKELLSNIKDLINVRFICLKLKLNNKQSNSNVNKEYENICHLNAVQISDNDAMAPLLPPNVFWYNHRAHSLNSIEDCRSWYNNLIQWQISSKYKHRKYLFGSKYDHMFGLNNVNVIDWEHTKDIDISVFSTKSQKTAPIYVRKSPTSLSDNILLLHNVLKSLGPGNSRTEPNGGDVGQMFGLGLKNEEEEFVLSKSNPIIQKLMYKIGKQRKEWFMSSFPDIYNKNFKTENIVPYMHDSLSDTMIHSIGLGNSSHYDINDDSVTVSTWVEETLNNTTNWYLLFPNVTTDNVKATAIKLFHGCTICWDASSLRHASSVPSYRIRGGGTSSGNCELRKKKDQKINQQKDISNVRHVL